MFKEILNLKGHLNCNTGSKVTAILPNGWILHIGGASAVKCLRLQPVQQACFQQKWPYWLYISLKLQWMTKITFKKRKNKVLDDSCGYLGPCNYVSALHCSKTLQGTLSGVQNSMWRRLRGQKLRGLNIEGKIHLKIYFFLFFKVIFVVRCHFRDLYNQYESKIRHEDFRPLSVTLTLPSPGF